HMAGFILISGYFAKGFRRPGYLTKIAKKTLPTFIIFQIIYTVVQVSANNYMGEDTTVDLNFVLAPRFTLWFLLSLYCWNVLLFLLFSCVSFLFFVFVNFIMLGLFIIFICNISLVVCSSSICSRYFYQFYRFEYIFK